MKDLIKGIAEYLVDRPEKVNVTENKGGTTSIFELSVAKEDVGKVIGKRGRTATAIRTILSAAAARENRRSVLEILD